MLALITGYRMRQKPAPSASVSESKILKEIYPHMNQKFTGMRDYTHPNQLDMLVNEVYPCNQYRSTTSSRGGDSYGQKAIPDYRPK